MTGKKHEIVLIRHVQSLGDEVVDQVALTIYSAQRAVLLLRGLALTLVTSLNGNGGDCSFIRESPHLTRL